MKVGEATQFGISLKFGGFLFVAQWLVRGAAYHSPPLLSRSPHEKLIS